MSLSEHAGVETPMPEAEAVKWRKVQRTVQLRVCQFLKAWLQSELCTSESAGHSSATQPLPPRSSHRLFICAGDFDRARNSGFFQAFSQFVREINSNPTLNLGLD